MGRTALHYAAASNQPEALRTLLKFGANINAQTKVEYENDHCREERLL